MAAVISVQYCINAKCCNTGRPVAARNGSLICSSNNNDNNNQRLKTMHNQTNTKELLCRTSTITDNRATSLLANTVARLQSVMGAQISSLVPALLVSFAS